MVITSGMIGHTLARLCIVISPLIIGWFIFTIYLIIKATKDEKNKT